MSSALRKVATHKARKTAQNDGFFRSSRTSYRERGGLLKTEGGLSLERRSGREPGAGEMTGERGVGEAMVPMGPDALQATDKVELDAEDSAVEWL